MVDFETATDGAVTVRDRDTMRQDRIAEDKLAGYMSDKLGLP
jgi:glycyl-tRNA synthetase